MPITERIQAVGDWSLRLRDDTPTSIRAQISTPFGLLVVTRAKLPSTALTDSIALTNALYAGVCLRPGPQFELGGCGLLWFLQGTDATFGNGFLSTVSIAAGSLSTAVTTVLSGTGFTSGTIAAGTVNAYEGADVTRGMVLRQLAEQLGYEFRIKPDLTVDVASAATLYGSSPSAVVVRRVGPKEVASPYGIVGTVASTWDFESYASAVVVWTTSERKVDASESTYRGPTGSPMTIYRGYEFADAPSGAASAIATTLKARSNRAVRTVTVTSEDFAVTGTVGCGGTVWLHDVENGLVDTTQQLAFGGNIIQPVSAKVQSVTYPVERGMGCYYRLHDGTNVTYTDISDWIEWESPGVQFEVSTAAQTLTDERNATLQDLWSPWQPYAAEWRAQTGPDPAIGNGTIKAAFRRLGTALSIRVEITSGTTSTYGVGTMAVTMPPGCVARAGAGTQLGEAIFTSDASAVHPGTAYVNPAISDGTTIYLAVDTSPWTYADGATDTPFIWAAGSKINVNMTIEINP